VATTIGVLLALAWPVGLFACGVWLATALVFRISSLAALVALAAAPLAMFWLADVNRTVIAALLALLAFARHSANIRRLLKGEEPKIGGGDKPG
jgi:glycerol-3-phosphate acyltransferase PlsY